MSPSRIFLAVAVVITVVSLPVFVGAQQSYTEDFTTTTYTDVTNTTADWNTAGGQLRLFPLPQLIGNYDTPGNGYGVAVAGDYAYIADGNSGLTVVDISNPAAPTLAGSYDTPWTAWGVAVSGDHAFVADGSTGLVIIDISDPTTPTLAGTFNTNGSSYGVFVEGDYAYVADWALGLQIIDVTDPTAPSLAGSYNTAGYARGVWVAGDYAYVADGSVGLQVININNPAAPTLAGTVDTPDWAMSPVVSGDHLYVADGGSGVQVIDISDPTTPVIVGSYDTPNYAYNVFVTGNRAYVADGISGLVGLDIGDPTNPTLDFVHDTPNTAQGVIVAGENAFVADSDAGLQVIEVHQAMTNLIQVGSYDPPGATYDIAVAGDVAFVADFDSGIHVLDISDPASPTLLSSYNTASGTRYVDAAGDLAFVSSPSPQFHIIDISNPGIPQPRGYYIPPSDPQDMVVVGNLVYLADFSAGLLIIDVSNPASPALHGSYNTLGTAFDVAVSGDIALVPTSSDGVYIIDVSDPANPSLVTIYDTATFALGVAVSGDLAFVARSALGLDILDISNPASPIELANYDHLGSVRCVTVSGNLAFLGLSGTGSEVIDISDPTNPVLVGAESTPGSAFSVVVAGDLAFIGDYDDGLRVVQTFQGEADAHSNVGQSLTLGGTTGALSRMRLSATQTSGVSWEVSGNGGTNWQAVAADTAWNLLTVPGTEPRWRATLTWSPTVNPSVSDVTVEWLNEFPFINSITDIPNDQGRQVRVEWARSGHDFVADAQQIVEYAIYRAIDANLNSTVRPFAPDKYAGLSSAAQANAELMLAAGWDFVTTVPVLVEDSYAVVVPTLADSTIVSGQYMTTFRVTALTATPGVYFHSPPDSGYSVDDLAPGVPQAFTVAYNTGGGNTLAWDDAPEPDFQYYRVYRSSDPNFSPAAGNLVHETATPGWVDPDYDGGMVYYKVTALDFSGNESDPASAGTMTAVPSEPVVPDVFALHQNYPNPFNPTTLIRYDVPRGGAEVTLRIYDVSGRLVRTLVDGRQAEGEQHATWDSRDGAGRRVSTGTYFYRLTAPGFEQTRKMVLLK